MRSTIIFVLINSLANGKDFLLKCRTYDTLNYLFLNQINRKVPSIIWTILAPIFMNFQNCTF